MYAPRSGPIPKLNLSVLGIVSSTVPDSDNKVFIGGLPYNLTEDQVRRVLIFIFCEGLSTRQNAIPSLRRDVVI